jgi:hypothetical protein
LFPISLSKALTYSPMTVQSLLCTLSHKLRMFSGLQISPFTAVRCNTHLVAELQKPALFSTKIAHY